MTDLIIASFTQESHAIEASNKLFELESIGEISIYELAIIKKDQGGKTKVLNVETHGGLPKFPGMLFGISDGAPNGPVGMVVQLFSGTFTGAVLESEYFSFSEDLGSKLVKKLQAGTVAIVAEIDENSTVFVDETFEAMGGTIARSNVDYDCGKYADEQIEMIDEEIAAERIKIKIAVIQEKEKIQKRISGLKESRREKISELKTEVRRISGNGKSLMHIIGKEPKESYKNYRISKLFSKIEKYQAKIEELRNEIKRMEG